MIAEIQGRVPKNRSVLFLYGGGSIEEAIAKTEAFFHFITMPRI